jgi:hydroxysqualene dehydroxylase
MSKQKIAIIGGGWAGLAAAVEATQQGHQVSIFEMAPQLGGRARQIESHGTVLDNGQHILIGAYTQTLALMRHVGVDIPNALMRIPLTIAYPDGKGLVLKPGPVIWAFTKAVLTYSGWHWRDKLALLTTTSQWALNRFQCKPELTVSQLTAHLPLCIRTELLDPLCVAALNTPIHLASASVFLRVLHDALFSGKSSADLLLPRRHLSQLWPEPAAHWLLDAGATIHLSQRVEQLHPNSAGWQVDGHQTHSVVLACTASEAARLVKPHAPDWSAKASALRYEPIVTIYAQSHGVRLPQPMMALVHNEHAPAQYVFDLQAINGLQDVLAFVISGASLWVERGTEAILEATLQQGQTALAAYLQAPLINLRIVTEKRATFLCTPALKRPETSILPRLVAAGDYIAGPYPASLEGAVRSGIKAFKTLITDEQHHTTLFKP